MDEFPKNTEEGWVTVGGSDPVDTTPTLTYDDELTGGYFVIIGSAFIKSNRFSLAARVLYGILVAFAGAKETAFPGTGTLCEMLGVSHHTFMKARQELVEAGLLSIKRRGQGKTSIYHLSKHQKSGKRDESCSSCNSELAARAEELNTFSKTKSGSNTLESHANDRQTALPLCTPEEISHLAGGTDARKKPKGRATKPPVGTGREAEFEKFWTAYPKKQNKVATKIAWYKVTKEEPGIEEQILEGLQAWKKTQQWREGFIPMPVRFIANRRWEDDIPGRKKAEPVSQAGTDNELMNEFLARQRKGA